MGNCSLRAVTDATQGPNEGVVRMKSSSTAAAQGSGVWKVKLVIDPKDLERILSEEVNTEAFFEQMRVAANSTPMKGKSSWSGVSDKFVC